MYKVNNTHLLPAILLLIPQALVKYNSFYAYLSSSDAVRGPGSTPTETESHRIAQSLSSVTKMGGNILYAFIMWLSYIMYFTVYRKMKSFYNGFLF